MRRLTTAICDHMQDSPDNELTQEQRLAEGESTPSLTMPSPHPPP